MLSTQNSPNTGMIDRSTTVCYTYGHPRDRWWCHSSPSPTMTIVFFTCYGESSTSRINNLFLKKRTTWCDLHRSLGVGWGIEPPLACSSLGAFTTGPSPSGSNLLFSHNPLISLCSTRSKLEIKYPFCCAPSWSKLFVMQRLCFLCTPIDPR